VTSVLTQIALPFFLGLLAGRVLSTRSPGSRWAHVVYGVGTLAAIWLIMLNPFTLPPVITVPGLVLGGVLSGMFDVRRLRRNRDSGTAEDKDSSNVPQSSGLEEQ